MSEASGAVLTQHELSESDLEWARALLRERAAATGGAVRGEIGYESYEIEGESVGPVYRSSYPSDLNDVLGTGLDEILGWAPSGILGIVGDVGARAHRVVGEVCLALAERWEGIINFGGALPLGGAGAAGASLALPRCVQAPEGLAGNLYITAYGTSTLRCYYGDSAFLRSWLAHPAFTLG